MVVKLVNESKAGYTGGEIRALVAPMLEMEPDDINHVAVIAGTMDGRLVMFGCGHAPILLRMAADEIRSDNFGPDNLGPLYSGHDQRSGNWLARILRHL
jgi:hypothetical protein